MYSVLILGYNLGSCGGIRSKSHILPTLEEPSARWLRLLGQLERGPFRAKVYKIPDPLPFHPSIPLRRRHASLSRRTFWCLRAVLCISCFHARTAEHISGHTTPALRTAPFSRALLASQIPYFNIEHQSGLIFILGWNTPQLTSCADPSCCPPNRDLCLELVFCHRLAQLNCEYSHFLIYFFLGGGGGRSPVFTSSIAVHRHPALKLRALHNQRFAFPPPSL